MARIAAESAPDVQTPILTEMALADNSLEGRARAFAESHTLVPHSRRGMKFAKQLDHMHALLQQAYQRAQETSQQQLKTSYASEWLLDNYYIVQQAVRQIRQDMP